MAKIEVNAAGEIVKKHKVDPETARAIIEEFNLVANPEGDEGETPPAQKKQFVILVSDPDGAIKRAYPSGVPGWVLQIPDDASPYSVTDRVFKGAYDFNASKRGRLLPVKSVGEALESASARFFKEAELWVKTKMPVAVIVTDNVLPRDDYMTSKAKVS